MPFKSGICDDSEWDCRNMVVLPIKVHFSPAAFVNCNPDFFFSFSFGTSNAINYPLLKSPYNVVITYNTVIFDR